MKIPLEWLGQFVNVKEIPIKKLAEDISLAICEVEEIINPTVFDIRIGEIKSIKKIASSKKLNIAKVEVGNKQLLNIIFGDWFPIKKGDRVPVAVAPTILPTGMKIKKKELAGFLSEGMLVADSELGLNVSKEGIIRFTKSTKLGTNVLQFLGLAEILDLKITPNRGDLLSIYGFARDLSAFYGHKLNRFITPSLNFDHKHLTHNLSIKVDIESAVKRYSALKISGIKNTISPDWMQKRLISAGMRPINSVVDCTNYVMLELGQPLHAFDFEKISEIDSDRGQTSGIREIIIRRTKNDETITALDENKYNLPTGSIVIADYKKILALAGLIGSKDSGVTENTTQIVLESAIFNPINISQTSKALGLVTDASQRFEREIDSEITVSALKRVAGLIIEICGGKISSEIFDHKISHKKIIEKIIFSLDRLNKVSGTNFSINVVEKILHRLEFQIIKKTKKTLEIIPPSWRYDINLEEDVFEEIIRIYGYNHVSPTLPSGELSLSINNNNFSLENKIAQICSNLGWNETQTFSFYSPSEIKISKISAENHVKLQNPLGPETSILRASLLPGLLKSLHKNINSTLSDLSLFEIGHIFIKTNEKISEQLYISGVNLTANLNDCVLHVRLVIDQIFNLFNSHFIINQKLSTQAEILQKSKVIGTISILDSSLVLSDRQKRNAIYFEINLDELFNNQLATNLFQEIPPYPSVNRDVTIIIDKKIYLGDLIDDLQKIDDKIRKVELQDIYQKDKNDPKAVTLRIIYQDKDKTLTDEEVMTMHETVINNFKNEHHLKIK